MFSTPAAFLYASGLPEIPQPVPTSTLVAWFKSDTGVSTSGGLVTEWASQYGISGLVANPNTKFPSLTETLNGYTAVTMPSGSVPMPFNTAVSVASAYTFFAVAKQTGNYAEYVISRSGGSMAGIALTPQFGGPGIFLYAGGDLPIAGQNLITPQYSMWQSSSAGTNLRQNGVQVLSNGPQVSGDPNSLFSSNSSGPISIWELLIYSSALNSVDIATVETYLKNKYGLSYILDTNPGSQFAVSFRKLSSSYTGPCVRVRRDSDNAEQDIGFSEGYIDTASLTAFCGGGNGYIKTWYDQSGNGKNTTQATASLQPQIVTAGTINTYNGKVCGKYNGTSYLQTSATVSSLDFYSVHKFDTVGSQGAPMGFGTTNPNWLTYAFGLFQGDTLSLFLIQAQDGTNSYYPSAPASFWGYNAWYGNFTNMQMWRNNSQLTLNITGDGHAPAPVEVVLTGKRGFEGIMTGIIQEQIIFNTQTANQIITQNINDFYSIY